MCVNCSQKSAYQKPCCKSAPKFTVPQRAQPAFPSVNKHLFEEHLRTLTDAIKFKGKRGVAAILLSHSYASVESKSKILGHIYFASYGFNERSRKN